ncbi:MAG: alkaline phosphatase D family protein [Gammaproteobacteria bacterium]|nr:alkaline phosphatase D family protein [Gammaproteobacteria bacterium]
MLVLQGCDAPQPDLPLVSIDEVSADSVMIWATSPEPTEIELVFDADGQRQTHSLSVDGRAQLRVDGLTSGTQYKVNWRIGKREGGGFSFTTWPLQRRLRIAFGGDLGGQNICRDLDHGYPIFDALVKTNPDLFIGLGDLVYADDVCLGDGALGNRQVAGEYDIASSATDFIATWAYQYEDAALRRFRAQVPWFVTWDDHEVLNDFSPSRDFRASEPDRRLAAHGMNAMRAFHPLGPGPGYRSFSPSRHAEVFIIDTRSFRDPNSWPDSATEPKTLLGDAQRRWLANSVNNSQATWKLIATSVPLAIPVGTAEAGARDGWANGEDVSGFEQELLGLLRNWADANVRNIIFLSADVHFATGFRYQPFSDDFVFHEFVVGPLNAGIYPTQNLDQTLQPQRLYFHGPDPAAVSSFDDAMHWFNAGLIDIDNDGSLVFRLLNAKDEFVETIELTPR